MKGLQVNIMTGRKCIELLGLLIGWYIIADILHGLHIGAIASILSVLSLGALFWIYAKRKHLDLSFLNNTKNWKKRVSEVIVSYGWIEIIRIIIILGIGLFFLFSHMLDTIMEEYIDEEVVVNLNVLLSFNQVLVTPIVEEFVFRGVLYDTLTLSTRRKTMLVNAFIFGFLHFSLNGFFQAFLLGIATYKLREKNHDIYSGIMLHMFANAMAVLTQLGSMDYALWMVMGCSIIYFLYDLCKKKKDITLGNV